MSPATASPDLAVDPAVAALLAADAPVAIGVSGGKDSAAVALALPPYLDRLGHRGPRLLIHSDLGRTEWRDSLPTCERLAAATGLELVVVRRTAGDMLARWQGRWRNNVARYRDLRCVQLILPWSTPGMRFCTSELKTDVICRDLVRRWPGQAILSVSGIRRDESTNRRRSPISKPQAKLASRTHKTTGRDWHPLVDWTRDDVLVHCADRKFVMHEAYTRYGTSRVSCVYCIMSSQADLLAASTCTANQDLYRTMVALETESTFAFQGGKWLGDVAPRLLTPADRTALVAAKTRAAARVAAEARIPRHLLYAKGGWPTCVPTPEEAALLSEVRRAVTAAVGLTGVQYLDAASIRGRYAALLAEKAARPARCTRSTSS